MNTCYSCKFWSHNIDSGDTGTCSSPSWLRGYNITLSDMKPESVYIEDDKGWGFQTGQKFGCVHWLGIVFQRESLPA